MLSSGEAEKLTEQKELESVYKKVNIISSSYVTENYRTRGFAKWLRSSIAETCADRCGGIVGGWIGKYVGAAAGSATGNPVLAVGGYIGGRCLGRAAGAIAASYGASVAIGWYASNRTRSTKTLGDRECDIQVDPNFLDEIEIEESLTDISPDSVSFGDLHNIVLAKLFRNKDKYLLEDKTLNYELLLDDCAKYIEECDSINYKSKDLQYYKRDLIELTKSMQVSAIEFKQQEMENMEEFYNNSYRHLPTQLKEEEENIAKQARFDVIIGNTYTVLDKDKILECERDINDAIIESELSESIKQDLQDQNSLAAKTTIFWKNVKRK